MKDNLSTRYAKIFVLLQEFANAFILNSCVNRIYFSVRNMELFVNFLGNEEISIPFKIFSNKELLMDFCFANKISYFKYEIFFDFFIKYYWTLSIVGTKTFLGMEKFEILNENIDLNYLMKELRS